MSEVTYGAVDRVLQGLGFKCRVLHEEPPARWYEHAETGAVIALPLLPENHPVFPQHLAAVQGTLREFGIADPLDLAAKLQKAS
jgi:hypothetical protein